MKNRKNRLALSVLLLVAGAVVAAGPAAEPACRVNLERLGAAVRAYRLIHDGRSPARLSELFLEGLVNDLGQFACPASGRAPPGRPEDIDAGSSYVLAEPGPGGGGRECLVKEKASAHAAGRVLAAFADGTVDFVAGEGAASVPPAAPPPVTPPPPPVAGPPVTPPPPATNAPPAVPAPEDWPGRALFAAGRYAEALPLCDTFVAGNPRHRQARFDRGVMRLWLNRPAEALEDFRELVASDPGDAESRRLRALIELVAGSPATARTEAELLRKVHPQNPAMLLLHGQAALWNNDAPAARRSFAEALRLDPGLPARLYEEAGRFLAAGVASVAAQEYITVLQLDPRQAGAHYGLGFAFLKLGQRDRAIESFKSYLQMDSASPYADQVRQQLGQLGL